MKDGWNANGHTIPTKQFHYERKTVMNHILNIVLILALVLVPFTPLTVQADEHDPNEISDSDPIDFSDVHTTVGIIAGVGVVAAIVSAFYYYGQKQQFSANGDRQENLLVEQLERLEPIDSVGPQTNFTPTENANVHGAMYPVFEW